MVTFSNCRLTYIKANCVGDFIIQITSAIVNKTNGQVKFNYQL